MSSAQRLVTWKNLPDWKRDNQYILTGYRSGTSNWRNCLHSAYAYIHNETGNIHTHFWGGVLCIYYWFTLDLSRLTSGQTTWADDLAFRIFLASGMFCLFSSASFHTLLSHNSRKLVVQCNALDYVGITVLTAGSFYPLLYFGFHCEPFTRTLYIVLVTLFNIAAAYVLVEPKYGQPEHIAFRTSIFLGLGFFAIVPVCQWMIVRGVTVTLHDMGVKWFLLSTSCYVGGALIYANRLPERLKPGTFDYLFQSHQFLHVGVVMAVHLHYVFISIAVDYAYTRSSCAIIP